MIYIDLFDQKWKLLVHSYHGKNKETLWQATAKLAIEYLESEYKRKHKDEQIDPTIMSYYVNTHMQKLQFRTYEEISHGGFSSGWQIVHMEQIA